MLDTERHDAPGAAGSPPDPAARARRWTGALPVTAAVLLIGACAVLISPAVRHQLAQSFQRQPDRYVELYFAQEGKARSCPVSQDGTLHVVATVRSHLADRTDLPYEVAVTGPAGVTTARTTGIVGTTPGRAADFGAAVAVPTGAYTVQVTLTGRSERLVLHCGTES